jgi:hypothetical protein
MREIHSQGKSADPQAHAHNLAHQFDGSDHRGGVQAIGAGPEVRHFPFYSERQRIRQSHSLNRTARSLCYNTYQTRFMWGN